MSKDFDFGEFNEEEKPKEEPKIVKEKVVRERKPRISSGLTDEQIKEAWNKEISKMLEDSINAQLKTMREEKLKTIETLNDIVRVVNVLGVYQHPNQRKVLDEIIGSHSVDEVRKWLVNKYKELLG